MAVILTHLERAQQHFKNGAFSEAADALLNREGNVDLDPATRLLLGVSLTRARRNEEAIAVFEDLLKVQPDTYEALTWMAVLTKKLDGGERAIQYAERAIQLRPSDAAGYSALGACHQYFRRIESAIEAFKKAASLAPEVAQHQHNLALVYLMIHNHPEAWRRFERAIALAPRNPQSYLALAEDYSTYGSPKAIDVLVKGLEMIRNSPALFSAMGGLLTKLHRQEEAETHFRYAIQLSPGARAQYAAWLLDQGRFAEASTVYEEMLRDKPVQGVAYYGILQARKLTDADADLVRQMESLRDHSALGPLEEMHLRYALGKAGEQSRNYEQAMNDYDVANRLAYRIHNEVSLVGPEQFVRLDNKVIACYERMQLKELEAHPSNAPIFIVGMIRSGTTLLDQIISSHPSVKSAGELRYWINTISQIASDEKTPAGRELADMAQQYLESAQRLIGDYDRFTDKMPLNLAFSGIIHSALPNARFIHIRRDPVDTCLSVYTTYFGGGTPFAYLKENIVAYFKELQRMADYWRNLIPKDRFYEVSYEDLIAMPDREIPKIIEFCGLPWDEACLHHEKNPGMINTPSRWQARQPIYSSSTEKWRRYEPWLGAFAELLPEKT